MSLHQGDEELEGEHEWHGYMTDAFEDVKLAKRGTLDDGDPLTREERLELVGQAIGSLTAILVEAAKGEPEDTP